MGLFDFLKRKNTPSANDQAFLEAVKQSMHDTLNSQPDVISPDDYLKLRESESAWLESHYDFSSIKGINAIPVRKHLARPPGDSTTGTVHYYLHHKGYIHEQAEDYELALACFRKHNELIYLYYEGSSGKYESLALVKLLARLGQVDEAYRELALIEQRYPDDPSITKKQIDEMLDYEIRRGIDIRNYKWIQEHLPEKCPKSVSGYRRMKTQNTKNFQVLKQLASDLGKEL